MCRLNDDFAARTLSVHANTAIGWALPSSSQHAGKSRLLLIMLPGLGDAIGIAREAHLEQLHLLRCDRQELAKRRRVHGAARILLHFKAVEEHFRDAARRDHAAMAAQQAAAALAERLGNRVGLRGGADMGRVRMDRDADEAEAV